jgi:hypothetical protein
MLFKEPAIAQKGLYFHVSAGPLKTFLDNNNGLIAMKGNPKGRFSAGESVYFHYGFDKHIGIKAGIQHSSMGINYTHGLGISSSGTDYLYGTLAIAIRSGKIRKRINLTQSVGLAYTSTGTDNITYISSPVSDSTLNKVRNLCFYSSIDV